MNLAMFEKCWQAPFFYWFDKGQRRFYSMSMDALLGLNVSLLGLRVKDATIFHLDTMLGLFT